MAISEKKYVDFDGLKKFKELLVGKYTDGSYTVLHATNADVATNYKTGDGSASIADALDSKASLTKLTEEVNKLVPKETKIADVAIEGGITKDALLKALNVTDGAQVNVIEEVHLKGSKETSFTKINPDGKVINIDLSNYALLSDITSVLQFKGTVDYEKDLPAEATQGDVYHVKYSGESGDKGLNAEYVYIVESGKGRWELLGPVVDFSNYYTKSQTDSAISGAVSTAKTEITNAYQQADTALKGEIQGNIDALYKVVADGTDTGVIAGRLDAVETKATDNASAIETLNGGVDTEGSVAKAIKDKIATLNSNSSEASGSDAKGGYVYSVSQTNGVVAVKTATFSGAVAQGDANAVTGGAVATYVTGAIGDLDVANIGSAGSFISAVGETDGKVHAEATAFVATVKATTTEADNVAPNEHAVRTAIDSAYNMITAVPLEGASGSIASLFA